MSTHIAPRRRNQILAFTLSLCFVFASVAHFSSLLSFHSAGGATCAFVVAWGGMAAQTARLIGLVILFFELRYLGIERWESAAFVAWATIGVGFIFVNNAIGTGSLSSLGATGLSFCQKKHVLPTSLTSSLIYLVLELFVIGRFLYFIAPPFFQLRHQLHVLNDLRLLKAGSLLLLELLMIVPSAIPVNEFAQVLPFSIGAVIVLVIFNYQHVNEMDILIDPLPASTPSRISTGGWRRSLVSFSTRRSVPSSPAHASMVGGPAPHPFSATSLRDPTPHRGDMAEQLHVRSSTLYVDSGQDRREVIPKAGGPRQGSQQPQIMFASHFSITQPQKPLLNSTASAALIPSLAPPGLPLKPQPIRVIRSEQNTTATHGHGPPPVSALFGSNGQILQVPQNIVSAATTPSPASQAFPSSASGYQFSRENSRRASKLSRWPTFNETEFVQSAFLHRNSSKRSSLSSLWHLRNFPVSPPARQSVGGPRAPRPPPPAAQR